MNHLKIANVGPHLGEETREESAVGGVSYLQGLKSPSSPQFLRLHFFLFIANELSVRSKLIAFPNSCVC